MSLDFIVQRVVSDSIVCLAFKILCFAWQCKAEGQDVTLQAVWLSTLQVVPRQGMPEIGAIARQNRYKYIKALNSEQS